MGRGLLSLPPNANPLKLGAQENEKVWETQGESLGVFSAQGIRWDSEVSPLFGERLRYKPVR